MNKNIISQYPDTINHFDINYKMYMCLDPRLAKTIQSTLVSLLEKYAQQTKSCSILTKSNPSNPRTLHNKFLQAFKKKNSHTNYTVSGSSPPETLKGFPSSSSSSPHRTIIQQQQNNQGCFQFESQSQMEPTLKKSPSPEGCVVM